MPSRLGLPPCDPIFRSPPPISSFGNVLYWFHVRKCESGGPRLFFRWCFVAQGFSDVNVGSRKLSEAEGGGFQLSASKTAHRHVVTSFANRMAEEFAKFKRFEYRIFATNRPFSISIFCDFDNFRSCGRHKLQLGQKLGLGSK